MHPFIYFVVEDFNFLLAFKGSNHQEHSSLL